jgi:hypothetical protein
MKKLHPQLSMALLCVGVTLAILFTVGGGLLLMGAMSAIFQEIVAPRPKISEVTSPLKPEVVQDICSKFGLPKDDDRCRPGATVYAPDFFPLIRESFTPGVSTYDDVQEKLGAYQYKCEKPTKESDGTIYFVCSYDLQGDRVFHADFFFTGEGTMWKMFASTGGS